MSDELTAAQMLATEQGAAKLSELGFVNSPMEGTVVYGGDAAPAFSVAVAELEALPKPLTLDVIALTLGTKVTAATEAEAAGEGQPLAEDKGHAPPEEKGDNPPEEKGGDPSPSAKDEGHAPPAEKSQEPPAEMPKPPAVAGADEEGHPQTPEWKKTQAAARERLHRSKGDRIAKKGNPEQA